MNKNDAKLEKKLGVETVAEIRGSDDASLKARIIAAEQAMRAAKDELEANPKYQELKESLGVLTQGMKEVNSRQRAIIQLCLITLDGE